MKYILFCFALFFSLHTFSQVDHWETIIYENNIWRYLLPTAPVPGNWVNTGFSDGNWLQGMGGIGYGDGDDATIIPPVISCYKRRRFQVIDKSKIAGLIVNVDYDDAFVMYLNGTEIWRENITSSGPPAYNQGADGWHEAEMYQGGSPAQLELDTAIINNLLQQGNNLLAIQTHNTDPTSSDMTSRVWLHVGINDNSSTYGNTPPWFIPPFVLTSLNSNLPIVVIETSGQVIPDEPKITAQMGIINNGPGMRNSLSDPFNEYNGYIGIEIRGSTSAFFPKKQYGLETRTASGANNNVSLFGWPKENDWVLYAPYSDKSLMRNVLTYGLSNKMGHWAARTQFCEVVLNGEYMGVYVFMEKIKRDKGRVDVANLTSVDTTGDELSGGYILKIDKTTGGDPIAWVSPYLPSQASIAVTDFQLHDPEWDELLPVQQSYIRNHVTTFETALKSVFFTDPVRGYAPYIDKGSFIDFFIANEISKNVDGYRLSTFFYKEKDSDGGKLVMGPLWDFNLAWGNADYCEGSNTMGWEMDFNQICLGDTWINPFWWERMVRQDTGFANDLKCRWEELRIGPLHTDSLLDLVDAHAALLAESQQRNFTKWPILGTYVWPNNFVGNTYADEINYLKSWIRDRMDWMDANMFGTCGGVAIDDLPSDVIPMRVYPNPASDILVFQFYALKGGEQLVFYNQQGQRLEQHAVNSSQLFLSVEHFVPGMYFYSVERDGLRFGQGKWVKN